jgi:signal transduction histidine kinase
MSALPSSTVRRLRLVRFAPVAAGVAVAAIGALVLAGWAMEADTLKRVGHGLVSMKANTALGFLVLGVALLLLTHGRSAPGGAWTETAGRLLGAFATLMAVATLGQYATGIDLGIDQLLFRDRPHAVATVSPGRMALNTAFAFLMTGLATVAVGRKRIHTLGEVLAVLTAFIGFQALVGYALGVDILYGLPNATAMALHTAAAFVVLALGLILVSPETGWLAVVVDDGAAGVAFRRLMPVALLAPLGIVWLASVFAVQAMGLDDRFALSVAVTLLTLLVVLAVGLVVHQIRKVDLHRNELLRAERDLRAELEDALALTEQASEAKSAFMATVSHELRTPLSAIIGYIELLKEGIPHPLHETQREPIERVGLSARHLRQIIEEILAFSRLESGTEEARVTEVRLDELLDEIRAVIEPLTDEKGLSFRIDSEGAPEELRTDPNKLRQILLNLLGNAVKFTPDGEVALLVVPEAGRVVFEVRDTGIGISPEDIDSLFDPFWRGDNSNTGSTGGTGLGLTICARYATLLDGELAVESEPDSGTSVSLRLPCRSGARP